jgi:transaldolase
MTLWKAVARENVMIKVPGTAEGIPAFHQLISEGININVTLLFAQEVYVRVAEAYITGLEQFAARGGDVSRIASVASFFIGRIDSLVDSILAARLNTAKVPSEQETLKSLQGKVAIANGKQTYKKYQTIFGTDRWKALAAKGGQAQRVLWASTSTTPPTGTFFTRKN